MLTHGEPCPVSDLFGMRGRQPLARLALPEPWQGTIDAGLRLIDELDRETRLHKCSILGCLTEGWAPGGFG